jgi:XTP/dITP diphosphohydrolase
VTSLLLASRSAPKAAEIARIVAPLRLQVVTLRDLDVDADPREDDIEAFDTFRQNAVAKARWFSARLNRPTLADDSGLRVAALGGRPGVRTKRFSGRSDLSGAPLDQANNERLIQELHDAPDTDREAHYVCCAALAWPDGRAVAAVGTSAGRIAREPRGEGGFGYDPLFYVPALERTFAQVPSDVKNSLSHRGRAFRGLAAMLARPPWPLSVTR